MALHNQCKKMNFNMSKQLYQKTLHSRVMFTFISKKDRLLFHHLIQIAAGIPVAKNILTDIFLIWFHAHYSTLYKIRFSGLAVEEKNGCLKNKHFSLISGDGYVLNQPDWTLPVRQLRPT